MVFVTLLLLCACQGMLVSGFVPILRAACPEHASSAFAACFLGVLVGQALIVRVRTLREGRLRYVTYQLGFGASLAAMAVAIWLAPVGLVPGRLIEGIFAGLGLPLTFERVAQAGSKDALPKRIAIFNGVYAIGFVAGPWLLSRIAERWSAPWALLALAPVPVIVATIATALQPRVEGNADEGSAKSNGPSISTLYTLILGKTFYGFLLPFATTYLLPGWSFRTEVAMLLFSGAFFCGQITAGALYRPDARRAFVIAAPLALAACLGALFVTRSPWFMVAGSFVHAWLIFLGFVGRATRPTSARDFAFNNSSSDPGLVIGALLSHFGWLGIGPLVAASLLSTVAFGRRRLRGPLPTGPQPPGDAAEPHDASTSRATRHSARALGSDMR